MTNQDLPVLWESESRHLPIPRATVWQRLAAYMIDMIILGLISGFLQMMFGSAGPASDNMWWTSLGAGIALVIQAVYFLWPYSTNGQTIGKRALKIKVVSLDGSPLSWRKGVLRTVGYILSSIPLGFGFLVAVWDAHGQAGHDKIAGTCVVPASVTPEELQGTTSSSEMRRSRTAWLAGLSVPAMLLLIWFGLFVHKGVAEVTRMGPWPAPDIAPREVAAVDLSSLGLTPGQALDARGDQYWAGGSYTEGVVLTYSAMGYEAVKVLALRYADVSGAAADFGAIQAWNAEPGNCGMSTYAYFGSTGLLRCQYSDANEKIFWRDRWVVGIQAVDGPGLDADIVVDLVRDALAAHWKAIAQGAS